VLFVYGFLELHRVQYFIIALVIAFEVGRVCFTMKEHKTIMKHKGKSLFVYLITLVACIMIVCVGCATSPYNTFEKHISNGDLASAVEVYNQEIIGTEDQIKADEFITLHVDSMMQSFENGEVLYEDVASDFQVFLTMKNESIVATINEFLYVNETIQAAERLYDDAMFEESFAILAMGLQEYPENEKLSSKLVDFCDHYIISITQQVQKLCEEEKYKEAIDVLEEAIEQYECDEFNYLLESTKEQKSVLYKLKNDLVAKVKSITAGWTEEEFDVKQAANDTGAYIVKSGKKLVLGDYADDDITVLSFTGNVVSSIAGVDLLFDLRDLSYDITHWGEEEYFVAYLAADVVALLPVFGVVKYLEHVKDATTVVESVADIGKNTDEVVDIVDAVADAGKTADKVTDAVDSASDAAKTADKANDMVDAAKDLAKAGDLAKNTDNVLDSAKQHLKVLTKEYKYIPTPNQNLVGTTHSVTGVPFEMRKIKIGENKFKVVAPRFESVADIKLPDDYLTKSAREQEKYCREELAKKSKSIFSKLDEKFTEDELALIAKKEPLKDYTWHHDVEAGKMQLVNADKHAKTHHKGGSAFWGERSITAAS